ncbi:MAG: nuclear transport factor 2 family protein [Acidobacteriia bacterium]|nr:nuclear transport factor 2 family protein [Terriglobia bacterium]
MTPQPPQILFRNKKKMAPSTLHRRWMGTTLGLLLILIARSPVVGAEAPTKAEDEIRTVLQRQVEAWNRGDLEGFMQGYWDSPDLIFTSGGNVRRGWQTTLDRYKQTYPDKSQMGTLSFDNLEIHLLGTSGRTNLAASSTVVFGKWKLTRANDTPHGVFTLVLERFPSTPGKKDGGWKIVHDHTSSSP